jgi:hypothetical protein
LARIAGRQGDGPRAVALEQAALRLFADIGLDVQIAGCLARLARLTGRPGQWEPATRLLAAAEALLGRLRSFAPAFDIARDYAPVLAAARSSLGENAFALVWAAGHALPLADAIAEALAVVHPAPQTAPRPGPAAPPGLPTA